MNYLNLIAVLSGNERTESVVSGFCTLSQQCSWNKDIMAISVTTAEEF